MMGWSFSLPGRRPGSKALRLEVGLSVILWCGALLSLSLLPAAQARADKRVHAPQATRKGQATASAQAASEAASLAARTAQTAKLQADLVAQGNAALVRGDTTAAQRACDSAAGLAHAPDIEMCQLRAALQAGAYRQALAYAAHTAGEHLETADGALLYAWLLHVGGQEAVAQRLLDEADKRHPHQALIAEVRRRLKTPWPMADGALLGVSLRLAPYPLPDNLPSSARVLGSASLVDGGQHALVPASLLPVGQTAAGPAKLWLRNGLGRTVAATIDPTVEGRLAGLGVVALKLAQPLPCPELPVAARDAFPGSPGYAVEYATQADATPAWPLLRLGFLGMPDGASGLRMLGIQVPAGARGGPVFDAAGRLAGVAVNLDGQPDRVVPASVLRSRLGAWLGEPARLPTDAPAPRLPLDEIYENALWLSLQLIMAPQVAP